MEEEGALRPGQGGERRIMTFFPLCPQRGGKKEGGKEASGGLLRQKKAVRRRKPLLNAPYGKNIKRFLILE